MGRVDRQVIIQLEPHILIGVNASVLNEASEAKGVPSQVVKLRPGTPLDTGERRFNYADIVGLKIAFRKLTSDSRVYLQGHGDWRSQTLSGYTGEQVAAMLVLAEMPAIWVVSVLGCSLGRDTGAAGDARLATSMNSFASKLHYALLRPGGRDVCVHARVYDVVVANRGIIARHGLPASLLGKKGTLGPAGELDGKSADEILAITRHRQNSKLFFFWENGAQQRDYTD